MRKIFFVEETKREGKKLERENIVCGVEESGEGKGGKYFENENIFCEGEGKGRKYSEDLKTLRLCCIFWKHKYKSLFNQDAFGKSIKGRSKRIYFLSVVFIISNCLIKGITVLFFCTDFQILDILGAYRVEGATK